MDRRAVGVTLVAVLVAAVLVASGRAIAETVVTELDKPLDRKLEPILEHKVTDGAPVAEVSAMIAQGRQLIAQAIREIDRVDAAGHCRRAG